ncbi:MAG: Ig-like domain-containing protein [Pseudomonadota bacterium]
MKKLAIVIAMTGLLGACNSTQITPDSEKMTPGTAFVPVTEGRAVQVDDGASDVLGGLGAKVQPAARPIAVPIGEDSTPVPILESVPTFISITSPSAGATISGVVTIQASVSMPAGVDHVEFYLDRWATDHLMGIDATAPYELSWDTTAVVNGTHTLGARAYDKSGNLIQKAHDIVTLNSTVSTPSILITSPSAGASLAGAIKIKVSVSMPAGVDYVEFYLDRWATDHLMGVDTTAPYELSWDTTQVASGTHTLGARAYDKAGKMIQEAHDVVVADRILITSPSASEAVSGTVTIQASVSMPAGVDHVEFYLDRWATDHLMGIDATAPYELSWDTTQVASGTHTLGARAYDKAGKMIQEAHDVVVRNNIAPPTAATLTVGYGIKQLEFSWDAVAAATHYKFFENPDGASGFTQLGSDLTGTTYTRELAVWRHNWAGALYRVEACNAGGCTPSNEVGTAGALLSAVGYFKASNTGSMFDGFGYSLALSGDGSTLAVGATGEDSNATGINGNQADESAGFSGAVYVFSRSGGTWSQQAYVKASNTEAGDLFGYVVALSDDGATLAVGADTEDSNATGIDGNQADNSAVDSGAVYVFSRSGTTWSQQAYVKASNTEAGDRFGWSIALGGDGNTLAVGATTEDSNATGIGGSQADNSAADSGAVYLFSRSGSTWSQQEYIKASNTQAGDKFGWSVALAGDGATLAVGTYLEASNATGIDGNQADNSVANAGAVYVFASSGGAWSQQAYVKASNTATWDLFGFVVALSGDGNTLAVGAHGEDSNATGINGNQADNSASASGAVFVFARSGSVWSQQAYVKASNTGAGDSFGYSVSLSDDGNTLAVGAYFEASNATGVNGNQADNSSARAGAAYLFSRAGSAWSQDAYVKASNAEMYDEFGWLVALSDDGDTLSVSGRSETSNATGVGGNQADNSVLGAGAVYLY